MSEQEQAKTTAAGAAQAKLPVVLMWHMHQPYYRDAVSGQYVLPWTYLHATKDYTDMAAHLEEEPRARAVVNFAPTLLEQIDDYAERIRACLASARRWSLGKAKSVGDPLLDALAAESLAPEPGERAELIRACLRVNRARLVAPQPRFAALVALAEAIDAHPDQAASVTDQYIFDLVTWYHLVWLGQSVRQRNPLAGELLEQGGEFGLDQRRALVELIAEQLETVVPRYRALAEQGRVELSMTPYAHPIGPLLLDFHAAREARPETPLPEHDHYPGGDGRCRWHVEEGFRVFEAHFGLRPQGVWPAEGGVSQEALALLDGYDLRWAATGEQVLHNSGADFDGCQHRGFAVEGLGLRCFFRDDGLSDNIGFRYADWSADDAVGDLIHHLESIAAACATRPDAVCSIILDGENAWEYYPDNGAPFLSTLYRRLAEHPSLELTTFSAYLERLDGPPTGRLNRVTAGSWVYGDFATWLGHPAKNRAWDLLCEAKRATDRALRRVGIPRERRRAIERQLAVCEGSDWCWWFGDDNPSGSVRDFDRLYRGHLKALYALLEMTAPAALDQPISTGGGDPAAGGVMRPGQTPV